MVCGSQYIPFVQQHLQVTNHQPNHCFIFLRCPPIDYVKSTLGEIGFSVEREYSLLSESENLATPDMFFNKEGPLE